MAQLRALATSIGLDDVATLLASGNLVFTSAAASPARWEERLEQALADRFGFRTEVFVRSATQWNEVLAKNPYSLQARDDPGHLLMMALKATPPDAAWSGLRAAIRGRESAQGWGRHAYLVYPDGVGRSKLTPALIERHLGTPGTARNWNTVGKLAELVGR